MIKLSLFMTDPVKAHERYVAEVEEIKRGLGDRVKRAEKTSGHHSNHVGELQKKNAQLKRHIRALDKKLRDAGLM